VVALVQQEEAEQQQEQRAEVARWKQRQAGAALAESRERAARQRRIARLMVRGQ